jgi:hypothetical protein
MTEKDPFTQVYEGLWAAVDAVPDINTIVRPGNRINFTKPDLTKREIATADLPELQLVLEGAVYGLHTTSSGSKVVKRYTWIISTGSFLSSDVLSLQWMLTRAMCSWKQYLGSLTWSSQHFVKRFDLVDETAGISNPEYNRGIKGWSAVMRCEVEMHFGTASLIYPEP